MFADRTSAATMRANQLRLWLASMAYVLLCALRRIALSHTPASPRRPAVPSAWRCSRSAPSSPPACAASRSPWPPAVPTSTSSERLTPCSRRRPADETDSAQSPCPDNHRVRPGRADARPRTGPYRYQSTASAGRAAARQRTPQRRGPFEKSGLVRRNAVPQADNRPEGEVAGYRNVLLIHERHAYMELTPNLVLQLHRDLPQRGCRYASPRASWS